MQKDISFGIFDYTAKLEKKRYKSLSNLIIIVFFQAINC